MHWDWCCCSAVLLLLRIVGCLRASFTCSKHSFYDQKRIDIGEEPDRLMANPHWGSASKMLAQMRVSSRHSPIIPRASAIIECRAHRYRSMHHCALQQLQQHSSRLVGNSSRLGWRQLRRFSHCSPARAAGHQQGNGTGEPVNWLPSRFAAAAAAMTPVLTTGCFAPVLLLQAHQTPIKHQQAAAAA
jgi:hypothetical protein